MSSLSGVLASPLPPVKQALHLHWVALSRGGGALPCGSRAGRAPEHLLHLL